MTTPRLWLMPSATTCGLVLLLLTMKGGAIEAVAAKNLASDDGQRTDSPAGKGTPDRASPASKKAELPPPPPTWKEHWSEHNDLLELVASNDDVAIYFDDAMPRRGIAWMVPFVTRAWRYTKKTYGNFGPDPRLFAIFHQGKYSGGHPSTYFDDSHDRRSAVDCGLAAWDHASIDMVSHEMGHIVEGSNNAVHESPAFEVWKDSKWCEFYQYDLYVALGLRHDADRVYKKWYQQADDFPRPGTFWFRDFFYPLWRDHGHARVMVNFFTLLANNFSKESGGNDNHPRYTRRMNWGEFIHFISGAARQDLRPLATRAFGWPPEWEEQFQKARRDFPRVEYKMRARPQK